MSERPKPEQDDKGRFVSGNIGGGRPKGSRNKLGEVFVAALQADFETNGKDAIEKVRTEKPADYLRVIASLLPKQVEIKEGAFDGVDDDQLAAIIAAARSALGVGEGSGAGTGDAESPQPPEGVPAVH